LAELALMLVDTWLNSEFEAGRSAPKVNRIDYYESLVNKENTKEWVK
jgi:ribose 5-phosphate isomerase B